jgi:hypothetical protein
MGLFSLDDNVKISEKTGGAYADMSDVIDSELDDIFGSEWTSHGSKHDSRNGSETNDGCVVKDSDKPQNPDK